MKLGSIKTHQILMVACSMLLTHGFGSNAHELVTLYDHDNGKGESVKLNVISCTTMPRGWNHRVSSLLLMSKGCLELHESRICNDPEPMIISNPAGNEQLFGLNGDLDFNDRAMAVKPCSFANRQAPITSGEDDEDLDEDLDFMGRFTVTLYEFVERKGFQANVVVRDCAGVPLRLSKNIASVDPRGNCVRLYSGAGCTGDSVQIQPNDPGGLNLHFWNFLDQTTSVGVCEDFQLLGLTLQNKLRSRHNSPPLELNENLNLAAAEAAEVLANQVELPRQSAFHSGVLIYFASPQLSKKSLVRQAISSWYEDQLTFHPRNPQPSAFTQLVWKSSKEVGIGVAISANRAVVVAKYAPIGNNPSQGNGYSQNVQNVANFK